MRTVPILLLVLLNFPAFSQQVVPSPKARAVVHANRVRINDLGPGVVSLKPAAAYELQHYGSIYDHPAFALDFDGTKKPTAGFNVVNLWLGAVDTSGSIRVARSYFYNESSYTSGPLSNDWQVDSVRARQWDRYFRVDNQSILFHKNDFADDGVVDNPVADIMGWPGRGNPHFAAIHGFDLLSGDLAPFFDVNGDSLYNPLDGDYPHPPSLHPDLTPGELWWNIYNDTYGNQVGTPPGFEIHATAWGMACEVDTVLNETVFFSYRLINRSGMELDSVVLGLNMKNWLGSNEDDKFGTFVDGNAAYVYNGDNKDTISSINLSLGYFGNNPPAVSFQCFNQPMTTCMMYLDINGLCVPSFYLGIPHYPEDYFGYMNGRWRNGVPLTSGGIGYSTDSSAIPVNYVFPGDPNEPGSWTMQNVNSQCVYLVQSFCIGTLQPDSSATFDVAYCYHRGPGLNNLQNVSLAFERIDQLQALYNNQFENACNPSFCPEDCVWPGDMDTDGAVLVRDLLPLAVGWQQTGPERNEPILWGPHAATDWGPTINSDWDYKHLDANGDGVINKKDLTILSLFFGYQRPDYTPPADVFLHGYDLMLIDKSFTPVDPNNVKPDNIIYMRSEIFVDLPLKGIATTVDFDPDYFTVWTPTGNNHPDCINLVNPQIDGIELAIIDTSENKYFSQGRRWIGYWLKSKTISDDLPDTTWVRFKNTLGILDDGTLVPLSSPAVRYCFGGGCPVWVSTEAPEKQPEAVRLFPNPARNSVFVEHLADDAAPVDWRLFDFTGRVVQSGFADDALFQINVENLPGGLYLLSLPGWSDKPQRVMVGQ